MASRRDVRRWSAAHPDFDFPERKTDLHARTAPVGICLSGGGTRALSAGMGQLRGLRALGLLDRVRYLSCVSGGSWLSTAFTYYAEGAEDDDAFLGPVTEPEAITLAGLSAAVPKDCVGWTATQPLNPVFHDQTVSGLPRERRWVHTVGEAYFAPWGLFDAERPRAFTLDAASRDDVLARNPHLGVDDFHLARPNRPYLIVNGAVVGVPDLLPLERIDPAPLELTPLYGGSAAGSHVLFRAADRRWRSHSLGGGYTESWALHEADPAEAAAPLYQLGEASGTSSAFLAGFAQRLPGGLADVNPRLRLHSCAQPGAPAATFQLGDGGVIENFGLLALMRRKVARAIVFVNTSVPLSLEYVAADHTPGDADLDAYLPPLFGFHVDQTGVQTASNQVFRPSDFVAVVESLQAAKRSGGPVVTKLTHEVQANAWWGIEGGWSMEVLWVYLEDSPRFAAAIGDPAVREELNRRSHRLRPRRGRFASFPHYSTSFHNGPDLVQLTPEQVKLLADLTCWSVRASRHLIEPMFSA